MSNNSPVSQEQFQNQVTLIHQAMRDNQKSTNHTIGELTSSIKSLVDVSVKSQIDNARLMAHVTNNQERHDSTLETLQASISSINTTLVTVNRYIDRSSVKWSIVGAVSLMLLTAVVKLLFYPD